MTKIKNDLLSSTCMNEHIYKPAPVNPRFAKWMLDKSWNEMMETAFFWLLCGRPE